MKAGPDGRVYVLSQGEHTGEGEGSPAIADTGRLLVAEADGTFTVVVDGLDRPTSLEIVGDTFVVASLAGEVRQVGAS